MKESRWGKDRNAIADPEIERHWTIQDHVNSGLILLGAGALVSLLAFFLFLGSGVAAVVIGIFFLGCALYQFAVAAIAQGVKEGKGRR